MIAILSKILPFLKPVLGKLGQDSKRAQELRAEAELIEAKAFARKGRIAPRYFFQYVVSGAFAALVVWLLFWAVFPQHVASPLSAAADLFDMAGQAFKLLFVTE